MRALDEFRLRGDNDRPSPGQALLLHGHAREALPFLLRDTSPFGKVNLAIAYRWLNRLQESLDLIVSVISENPDLVDAWNSLGVIREDFGLFTEASTAYAKAWSLICSTPNPSEWYVQQIALNYAMSLMRLERFTDAWPMWELGRFNKSWSPTHPIWTGEPDAKVLIHGEGGYGDCFLFRRYLQPDMTFWLWDKLLPLPWPCSVLPISKPAPPKFTHCLSLLSLMSGMKSIRDIPHPDTFSVSPTPGYSGKWGICWGAEENGVMRKIRSIPIPYLDPLREFQSPWVSLYPGADTPDWIERPPISNWLDTASLIASLDVIVTVDTAIAHLSCLLGKPTIIILPSNSDWKWFTYESLGSTCPWWPTAKLVRNLHSTNWDVAISSVVDLLDAY